MYVSRHCKAPTGLTLSICLMWSGGRWGRVPERVASRRRRRKSWPFWEIELWSFSRQPATSLTQLCGLVCSEFNSSWVFWYYHCVSLQTAACSRRLTSELSRVQCGVGTAVAQWLRCCATNQKVAGSIPDGVIGIFHWHKILPIALWPWSRHSF